MKIQKKYKEILMILFLAILLWILFPIRRCNLLVKDFIGETRLVCDWVTLGWEYISNYYYYGWELTPNSHIVTFLELIGFFIISFIIVKMFKKYKKW